MTDASRSGDVLRDLIASTLDLYRRFDVVPNLEVSTLVFQEEVDELLEAAHNGHDLDHVAEEAADVFVTAIGICVATGVDVDQLVDRTRAVIRKNDAKTHDTHHINEHGKIARRYPSS
jgi:NTP pyrophosphatase (non-canonical NTP hydrolase)